MTIKHRGRELINIAEVWIANYVDFRIYNNYRRAKKMRWLRIPLVIDALLLCVNAIHPGFLFTISVKNVYIRGP